MIGCYGAVGPLQSAQPTSYNSQDDSAGSLGVAWRHSYERRLIFDSNQTKAVRPDGRTYTFTSDERGWHSHPDVTDSLVVIANGWSYTTGNGTTEHYDGDGRLLTITDRIGRTQNLNYDTEGRLSEVVDVYGRILQITYDSEGRLASFSDPSGTTTTYTYSDSRLASVTYPDGDERHYHYENAEYPNALTAIVDGGGSVISAWTYDENGRAVSSSHAGGVDDTHVAYNGDDSVTVINPLGKQTTYHFKVYNGVPKVVSIEGQATDTCEGANRAYVYNDSGFLLEKTDWRGTVTTYVRDEKGREVSRTEAAGTAESRTITTEWHPSLSLPVRITEPGKVTLMQYDEAGRLLSRTEQPHQQ